MRNRSTGSGTVINGIAVIISVACAAFVVQAQQTQPVQQAQRPQRTETEARQAVQRLRDERQKQRQQTGAPVELISNYIKANIGPVPASLDVSPFYTKYADALGIPVLASEKTPDDALLVARDIVNTMLAARPDLRKAMIARRARSR
jgi:hypothetical protein